MGARLLPAAGFAAAVFEAGGRDEPVVLLCADGKQRAARRRPRSGRHTNVCLVEGGLEAWEAEAEDEEAGFQLVVDDDGEGALTGSWV